MSKTVHHHGIGGLWSEPAETRATSEQRQIDGKIKEASPHRSQVPVVTCLPAGASVGARAARRRKHSDINVCFGTVRTIVAEIAILAPIGTSAP